MKQQNPMLPLLISSLVLWAGSSVAQQNADEIRDAGTIYSDNVVNLAPIEAVRKDLGADDEVGSKLTTLRDEYRAAAWKEYDSAGIDPRAVRNMAAEQRQKYVEIGHRLNAEFVPKALGLLSPDQQRRFRQIQFQSRLAGLTASALLAPEIAKELNLTDDQKERLNTVFAEYVQRVSPPAVGKPRAPGETLRSIREDCLAKAGEVLTENQKRVLETLKGREFDIRQLAAGAPPTRGK